MTHQSAGIGETWPKLQRASRAIVVVDAVESVRLMKRDENDMIERWRRFVHKATTGVLPLHGGRMVKSLGDGLLLDFDTPRAGLHCARDLLAAMADVNHDFERSEPIRLRIGLHAAEVVIDHFDIFGSAVNLTSRIAGVARPDEIVGSVDAVDQLVAGLDVELEDLGDCYLKHIAEPVRIYRLSPPDRQAGSRVPDHRARPDERTELPRPRLAVLNLSTDGAPAALGSMAADELAIQLAAHSTVELIARMSTRRIGSMPTADALHGLRVHYVLTGSCAVVGTRLLLALELVFTGEQRVVWSRSVGTTLDALVADPAAVLGDVGKGVMEAIESHETGRAHSLPLASLDSYSLMLGGLRLMHRLSRSSFERSREVFDELVTRHPRHPDGYAWLAKWHILQLHQGWSADPQASAAMARDMARRALDHDDRCVVAMIVSGMVRTFNERRLDEAERIYTNALESHPNEALGWLLKGMVHAFRGEGELAVAHTRHASELTPLDPMRYYYDSLGASAEASAGHYDRAIELAQRSLKANSMHASTLRILTIAYAMSDQLDAARGVVKRMRDVEPDFTVSRFLQRSPSSDFEVGRRFADALARAGVPP